MAKTLSSRAEYRSALQERPLSVSNLEVPFMAKGKKGTPTHKEFILAALGKDSPFRGVDKTGKPY